MSKLHKKEDREDFDRKLNAVSGTPRMTDRQKKANASAFGELMAANQQGG